MDLVNGVLFSDLTSSFPHPLFSGDIKFVWATVRAEFEKHRNVKDLRTAKLLMEEGERKLFLHLHPKPKKFMYSPGGLMYERETVYSDGHMDGYHPMEKAAYPYYFERREQLKREMFENWEKSQGKQANAPKTGGH